MIRLSWLRRFLKDSKGISTAIGTVLLVLAMFVISSNVFMWTISQNTVYSESVRESHQTDADRFNEKIVALNGNYTVDGDEVTVEAELTNAGSVAAQIINLWVFDTGPSNQRYNYTSLNLNLINLNPGDVFDSEVTVTIPGADPSHNFVSWFVTARGNTVPVTVTKGVIVAQLAQGIGSISMDFPQFRYYEVPNNNDGTPLGPPKYSFTIDSSKYTVFAVMLTNLDPSHKDINLTGDSYIWMITPHTGEPIRGDAWYIRKVQDNKLASFDFQILKYDKPTMVYFGATKPKWVIGVVPVNMLLFGKLGMSDYGQNLPFIALRVI